MSRRVGPRGRRWIRRMAGAAVLAGLGAGWAYGPPAIRSLETFRVQEVEVTGTRFLDPYAVVRAAGLAVPSSVFDDADAWRAGIRTLPLVDDVRVRRIYPGRIRLELTEVQPVALVAGATLRPVDASGRLLELEPAGEVLDLPVVTGVEIEGMRVVEGASTSAIETVAALLRQAPEVAERISQADLRGGELRLELREGRARAVLPVRASPVQITQLRLAVADLMARGELDRVRTLDVRFRDQVVVSFVDRP